MTILKGKNKAANHCQSNQCQVATPTPNIHKSNVLLDVQWNIYRVLHFGMLNNNWFSTVRLVETTLVRIINFFFIYSKTTLFPGTSNIFRSRLHIFFWSSCVWNVWYLFLRNLDIFKVMITYTINSCWTGSFNASMFYISFPTNVS